MKVLIVAATPYFSNRGCHIRIFLGAKYLQKKGVDVLLCTYHLGENVGDFPIKTISRDLWYKKTSPGFAWGKLWLDAKLLWLCVREIRRFRPDAIHAHLFEGLAIGYLAKIFTFQFKTPIVMDSQGDIEAEFNAYNKNDKLAKRIFVSLARKIIKLADYIILSSENALPCFEKMKNTKKKISVVKDGVGVEFLKEERELRSEKKAREEISQLKKVCVNKKVLIYSGGMEHSKGVGKMIKTFIKNKEALADWNLVLYGVGKSREDYRDLIKEKGFGDRILLTKETNFFVLPLFLRFADVAIDPKKGSTEGSGKLLNYMAMKMPIICYENDFNKTRLGKKGFYLSDMNDLVNVLNKDFPEEIDYNLENDIENEEVEKLFKVFKEVIKQNKRV